MEAGRNEMESVQNVFDIVINSIQQKDPSVMNEDPKTESREIEETDLLTREKFYTKIVEDFENNYVIVHKQKLFFKKCFFWIVMSLYGIVIIGSIFILIWSLFVPSNIALIISALASIISSVVAIPKIIAKYLFPTNEDSIMNEMICQMQKYDNGIRRFNSNSKDENRIENSVKKNIKEE